MAYTLKHGDQNVIDNIRFKFKDQVTKYSDLLIAEVWRDFSLSEDYPDDDKYLSWLADYAEAQENDESGD